MNATAKEVLQKAQDEGWALGAFNAANIETLKAIVQAASKLRAPVIVESSSGETKYFGDKNLADVVKNYREEYKIPIFINLDHAENLENVDQALDAGYELIHYDGSRLSYEENVANTKSVVEKAHVKGLLVEGELNTIAGSSADHTKEDISIALKGSKMTDPDEAAQFVEKTQIDTFAAFFGNVHGVYKGEEKLDFDLLAKIRSKVTCFLSMHGGSGISDEAVKKAIEVGKIVKINVNTELRMAFRESLEKALKRSSEVAAYKLMAPVIEAVQQVVEEKIKLFGSAGKANDPNS